jgi:hypothetical protein
MKSRAEPDERSNLVGAKEGKGAGGGEANHFDVSLHLNPVPRLIRGCR